MYEIYAFFNLEKFDQSTLEYFKRYLPPERKAKVRRYRREIDRKNCVISYLLLLHGLYTNYGIRNPRLSYCRNGKPFFPDFPNIHFNISHCPQGCICGISDSPIGVDIQDVRSFSQSIAERCCSKDELIVLNHSNEPASEFTRMWAMKESYLKMKGTGIIDDLRIVDTTKLSDRIKTFIYNDCYIAVASADFFQEESICML